MMGKFGPNVSQITDDNFESQVIKSSNPFLLDLSAEWCQPCQFIAPVIDELANEYVGKIGFGTLDIDQNRNVPTKYQVRAVPTLLLFVKGQVVGQLTGAHPRTRIVDLLNRFGK
ncbi:MAG: thioredoxin [Pseudomonadota bacterium]